jgi:hypothetical protein
MVVPDIHLEGIEPKDFERGDVCRGFREILRKSIPVVLSLPPWMKDYWTKADYRIIGLAREIVQRPGSALGQQGNLHRCNYQHKWADPWHENWCLWRPDLDWAAQKALMETGRNVLTDLMGIEPRVYASPNHQHDENTLSVARFMRYDFFVDRGMINLQPYQWTANGEKPSNEKRLIVIPEGDLRRCQFSRAAVYIHYDQISRFPLGYAMLLERATSINDVQPEQVSRGAIIANNVLKIGGKIARDAGRFGKYLVGRNDKA